MQGLSSIFQRLIAASVLMIAATAAAQETAVEAPASPEPLPGLETFVDGLMKSQLQIAEMPGATISIVKDGELIFAKGYGLANREERTPVDPARTLFSVGSVSKLFTWTAVMQLYEQGKLDLDADINIYLDDDLKFPETYDQPITLKHVMTHTPGLEDGALGILMYDRAEDVPSTEEWLKANKDHFTRVRAPGEATSYSNYATTLASHIVERISGQNYHDYIEANVLRPLGMELASFREPRDGEWPVALATAYINDNGAFKDPGPEFISHAAGAGSLRAPATEMARFMLAHLNHGALGDVRILQEDTAQLMHSRLYTMDERLDGMAHGFIEATVAGHPVIWHAGNTLWFQAHLALFPELNFGVFIAYNAPSSSSERYKFVEALVERYFPAELSEPVFADIADEALAEYAGSYRANRRSYTRLEKIAALGQDLSVSALGEGKLLTGGNNPRQWRHGGDDLFYEVDGDDKLVFIRGEDGAIERLAFNGLPIIAFDRLGFWDNSVTHFAIYGLAGFFFFLLLVVAWFTRKNRPALDRPGRMARRANLLMAFGWLAYLAAFATALAGVSAAGNKIVFDFPTPAVKIWIWLGLIAAILTVLAAPGVYFVWKDRGPSFFWKLRHTLTTLFGVAMVFSLWYWNMLGFYY